MRNHFFLLLLCCYLAVFLGLVFSVDTSYVLGTAEGRIDQALLWNELSKIRIFFALQVLFGSILFAFVGFVTLFVFWGPSRYFWLLGVLGFLVYYRLDPRYVEGESVFLFRGIFLFILGGLSERVLFNTAVNRTRSIPVDLLLLLACYCISLIFVRLCTHIPVGLLVDLSSTQVLMTLLLFLSGVLAHAAFLGSAKKLFGRSREPSLFRLTIARKYLGWSFSLAVVLLMGVTFFTLDIPSAQRVGWTLFSPFLPIFMSIYSPVTWFSSEGTGGVFAGDLLSGTGLVDGRARIFLGMFFQYLSLLTVCSVFIALRRVKSIGFVLTAHMMLVLYWLPTLWLAERLASLYK